MTPAFSLIRSCRLSALALLAFGLLGAAHAQTGAQVPLPAIKLNSGLYLIEAEVAYSYHTRTTGLMFRKQMPANHGMLFVFPQDAEQCMWMKNTLLPLSVAFVDATGVILNIEDMWPQTEDSHCSTGRARYALEMNRGWFAGKGIQTGARLEGLDKAPAPR